MGSSDAEEFESLVLTVNDLHRDLSSLGSQSELLKFTMPGDNAFYPTPEFRKIYVKPRLKSSDGQLYLFDEFYPNHLDAMLRGTLEYYTQLLEETKTFLQKNGGPENILSRYKVDSAA